MSSFDRHGVCQGPARSDESLLKLGGADHISDVTQLRLDSLSRLDNMVNSQLAAGKVTGNGRCGRLMSGYAVLPFFASA
jgi:hypothetical protein